MTKRKTTAAKKPKLAATPKLLKRLAKKPATKTARQSSVGWTLTTNLAGDDDIGWQPLKSLRPLEDLSDGILQRLDSGIEVSFTVWGVFVSLIVRSKQP